MRGLSKKRGALTTDDLMHLQEPDRKRMRRTLRDLEKPDEGSGASNDKDQLDEESGSGSNDEQSSVEEIEGQGEGGLDDDDGDQSQSSSRSSSPFLHASLSRISAKPRTLVFGGKTTKPMAPTFSKLGVSQPLQAALSSMSIRLPTEVQAACIPALIAGEPP